MKYISTYILFSLALAVCSLTSFTATSYAATYTVTNTADNGTPGTLREALRLANSTREDDTINFSTSGCSGGTCTIVLDGFELAVNSTASAGKLTITNATGANRLLISGNNRSRVFYINYGADLTLDGVTVTGGNGTGITDYNSNGSGGAIFQNYGSKLMLTNSAVTNSNAATNGGGIYIWTHINATLTMMNSTVSGNSSYVSGGIHSDCGIANICGGVKIFNSTLSNNTAQLYAGAIYNNYLSTLTLTNVTVTENRSVLTNCGECAGGIYNYRDPSTTVNLINTIVAGNTANSTTAGPDFSGAVSPLSSNNIIGNNKLTTGISGNGNQFGTPGSPLNPLLASRTYNGGGTETHSLLPFSPATDRGNNCVLFDNGCGNGNPALTGDQRGINFPRQSGGVVDVGAVEVAQTLSSFDISGTVVYATAPANQPKYVPGVTMSAVGTSILSTSTDSTGYYMLRNLALGGQYVVTPSKSGGVNGISSFDATLVLRHVAAGGNGTLTPSQRLAADSNNSTTITSFDATQILRYVAAGRSTSISGSAGQWKFTVSSRTYSATNSISGENYDGFLIGDVNGSWTPTASLAGDEEAAEMLSNDDQSDSPAKLETQLQISLPEIAAVEKSGEMVVPVALTNSFGLPIASFNFAVEYDPKTLQPDNQAVDLTGILSDSGCTVFTDSTTPGRLGIAASCQNTITAAQTQLNLRFRATGKVRAKANNSEALTFSQRPIFEDGNGQLLPVKIASFSGK